MGGIRNTTERTELSFVFDSILIHPSIDNENAWTAYRIGEAYFTLGDALNAEKFYKKAVDLAPFYPAFRSKYALTLATQKRSLKHEHNTKWF